MRVADKARAYRSARSAEVAFDAREFAFLLRFHRSCLHLRKCVPLLQMLLQGAFAFKRREDSRQAAVLRVLARCGFKTGRAFVRASVSRDDRSLARAEIRARSEMPRVRECVSARATVSSHASARGGCVLIFAGQRGSRDGIPGPRLARGSSRLDRLARQ